MKVRVTQEDIDLGIRSNPCYCPIARALVRKLSGKMVMVNHKAVTIGDIHGGFVGRRLPRVARQFIHKFDTNNEVSPFEFELDI